MGRWVVPRDDVPQILSHPSFFRSACPESVSYARDPFSRGHLSVRSHLCAHPDISVVLEDVSQPVVVGVSPTWPSSSNPQETIRCSHQGLYCTTPSYAPDAACLPHPRRSVTDTEQTTSAPDLPVTLAEVRRCYTPSSGSLHQTLSATEPGAVRNEIGEKIGLRLAILDAQVWSWHSLYSPGRNSKLSR